MVLRQSYRDGPGAAARSGARWSKLNIRAPTSRAAPPLNLPISYINPIVVAACIVTYRREFELQRLLDCLSAGNPDLGVVIVVDNAAGESGAPTTVFPPSDSRFRYFRIPSGNLGPGAGWKRAMEEALARFSDQLTHFWLLDDDVVVERNTLERLLEPTLCQFPADAVAPLLTDTNGRIWGFPEPVKNEIRPVMRRIQSPEDAVRRLGTDPIEFCWCTGACVLITRRAVETVGFPRTDFWMLGEDLEYSMRLSSRFRCVFLPDLITPHLPPTPSLSNAAAGRAKFLALLQNLSYLSLHSPFSRHMWSYLPGNFRRFFDNEGLSSRNILDATRCFVNGAVLARPRGRSV
jgi:GT2 family glycosyltransferase